MKNSTNYLIAVCLLWMSASCQKESVDLSPKLSTVNSTNLFNTENGYLSFASPEAFKSQIKVLQKLTYSDLIKWNHSISVTSALDEIESLNSTQPTGNVSGKLKLGEVINDISFASIVNSKGEFSVGTTFVRITPEIVFVGPKTMIDKIRHMNPDEYMNILPNKSINVGGVSIGRVSRENDEAVSNPQARFNGVDHTMFWWDDWHRSATVIYNDNWLVYRSLGTKVKFQNLKWWGGWWQEDTEYLQMNYYIMYDASRISGFPNFVTFHSPLNSCNNCGNITDTIDFDIAGMGATDGSFAVNLIDSPYDYKIFNTDSFVRHGSGIGHFDQLQVSQ